jgi:hypothetical protein
VGRRKKTQQLDAIQEAIDAVKALNNGEISVEERKQLLNEYKEQFKLQRLYTRVVSSAPESTGNADTGGTPESAELIAIRNYLEPLGLAPEGTPLSELARIAALKITEK